MGGNEVGAIDFGLPFIQTSNYTDVDSVSVDV